MKDIMDLDFLLDLDEGREDQDEVAARDRDIYQQIRQSGQHHKDDTSGLLAWLDYRRLLFYHETEGPDRDLVRDRLPGTLYASLYRWAARGMIFLGLIFGFLTAYSFLAYHGSRPVNVTLFIAFFILLPALLSLAAGTIMVRWIQSGGCSTARYAFFHTLVFEFFMKKMRGLVDKAADLPGGGVVTSAGESAALVRFKTRAYKGLLFWPLFMISSLAALCFSLGALGGTLFRVMVTDLAFGWQSTLFTSGEQIHRMVSGLALPWSWILPQGIALPSLAQVEGSRIILKQGIMGLATEHLTAWWPFLCMGILVYGVLPRLVIVAGAAAARQRAVAGFDFDRPRYRRLVMRMRSPRMDTDIRETGGTRAKTRAPLPDPGLCPGDEPVPAPAEPVCDAAAATAAWVLASGRVYPDAALEGIARTLDRQLGIQMSGVTRISFDFDGDKGALSVLSQALGNGPAGPVIILQEVWQPPIRGLLYYFTQIRQEIFLDHDIWIFLTQTPGEGAMAVETCDVNYQVWKTAVAQLKDPGIILERWMP